MFTLNTGTGFQSQRWETKAGGFWDAQQWFVADVNGDGLADMVNLFNDSGSASIDVHTNQKNNQPFITNITTGLSNMTEIVYKPLTDSVIYTKGSGAVYPEVDIQGAMRVVSSVSVSDGIGGMRDTTYQYEGLRSSVLRGSLGFSAMTSTDVLLSMTTRTEYSQTYPFTGQVVRSVQTFDNGTPLNMADDIMLSEVDSSFASIQTHTGTETVASHTGTVFSYADSLVKKNYKLDGTLVSTITSNNVYDSFGNPTTIVVDTAGLDYDGVMETYTTTTTNIYTNNETNWHLGRLTRSDVTQMLPSGVSGTRASAFSYDATSGLLTQEVVEPDNAALKLVTDTVYDAYGNKTSVTVSGGSGSGSTAVAARTTTSSYDARGQFAVSMTNALGHAETYTFDNRFGNMLSLTGPNGLTTAWTYDNFGRKVTEIRADGTTSTLIREWCDGVGNPNCPTGGALAITTQTDGAATTSAFSDALGRPIRSATLSRDGSLIYNDIDYNARGEIPQKSLPYFAGDTPLWSTFEYDALSRVYREIRPNGSQNNTGFNGLSTTNIDALNHITEFTKNVLGNVTQVYDADANDTFYRYDAFGNLIETEDAEGNIISNSYDIRGRKIAMSDPDMGNWTYNYNALGELISQTDAKSQTTTMVYDLLGRMTSRTEVEGISNWLYDTASNGIGKLQTETGLLGNNKTLTYDSLGRAINVHSVIESINYDVATSYDSYSRVNSITYPSSNQYPLGLTVDYGYTTVANDGVDGFLKTVSNQANSIVYWQGNSQDAAGQLTDILLGNGINTTFNYNAQTNLISGIQSGTTLGGFDIQNLGFAFDDIGNLTQRSDHNQHLVGLGSLSESFSYDTLNRMTTSTVIAQSSKLYGYDALGNITSKTGVGNYSYGSNAGPHAVTQTNLNGVTTGYYYDANGNMTSGNGRTITYTSYNKPNQITNTTADIRFTYGADRARIIRKNHTTGKSRHYIGNLFEQETHNSITTYTHYIKAGGSTVAIETSKSDNTNSTHYLHKDHLGSITAITDVQGLVIEEQSYDAYGKRRNSDWTDIVGLTPVSATTDRGFTGHEHIDEVGLVHMNGRVYDANLGRFISADPIIRSPLNSQSLNRYSYVMNNPLSLIDPSGFGWLSKAWKSIKGAIKCVFKAVNNIIRGVSNFINNVTGGNQFLNLAIAAVAAWYTGNLAMDFYKNSIISAAGGVTQSGSIAAFSAKIAATTTAKMIGGAVGGAILGGDLKSALTGGIVGSAFGAVNGYYGDRWDISRVVTTGTVGGASSELQGGQFKDGFLSSFVSSSLRYTHKKIFGYDVTWKRGQDIVGGGSKPSGIYSERGGLLSHIVPEHGKLFGTNTSVLIYDALGNRKFFANFFKQGGPINDFANFFPGAHSGSRIHDLMQVGFDRLQGSNVSNGLLRSALNVPAMIPAAAINYSALLTETGSVTSTVFKAHQLNRENR